MKTLSNNLDKQEVLRRLRLVGPDSARRWGKMTAGQMVCHLNDSFKAVIGERSASSVNNILGPNLIKWVALYLPIHWPHGVPTRPENDQETGGTKPTEFAADVRELEALVDRLTRADKDFTWGRHPLFGAMPDRDWLRWGYLHMDHHLRQFGV
jgi:Protein of unknown function (DUF1569)